MSTEHTENEGEVISAGNGKRLKIFLKAGRKTGSEI
jgi:hypothetical protein